MDVDPIISLVFVNYRSARYLQAALESLFSFEKDLSIFEIVIVNNDPSESVVLQALRREHPFLLIENAENTGFGQGSNLGASQARGKIIGFINPDILWAAPCLHGIAGFFDTNATVGVLGMMLLDEKKKPEEWSFGKEPSLRELFLNNLFPERRKPRLSQSLSPLDWVSGGALFVRKELFEEIGGFDKRFFLYFEDADLCKEVRNRGFLVVRRTEFFLVHLGGKSQASDGLQKKHFFFSQKEYFRKHRPRWESWILECLQAVLHKT